MTQATSPILRARDLQFAYTQRRVVDCFSADFAPGVTWLQGRNGSGKSTLLKLLAGALTPQFGHVEVHGATAHAQPIDYRRRVFWCGPGVLPLDHLTPLEYFGFMRWLYPSLHTPTLNAHLQAFNLAPHAKSLIRTLSTGTQRKVWLTAALSCETPVILLDEPLNALDAVSLQHLQTALHALAEQSSRLCVVASHEEFGAASERASVIQLAA